MNKDLSREELYESVWSKPITALAAEFGLSGVALAKRCRKLNIPTPRRGYWTKLAFGRKVLKPPLPKTISGPDPQVPASAHHSKWPRDVNGLCERARLLLSEMTTVKPDYEGLQSAETPLFPKVRVTKGLAEAAARLFHAILVGVESTGVPFRKSRSKYEGGYFELQRDRLYLEILEELRSGPSDYAWNHKKQGTGRLEIVLRSASYGQGWKKSWKQGDDGGLRGIVAAVARSVTEYYAERAKQKAEEAERWRIEHERWLKEMEERKQREHENAVADTRKTRAEDFLRAAEWARLHKVALEFVSECEARWRGQGPVLSPSQEDWLTWARAAADAWSPWTTGYPDPARDGAFSSEAVAFGGPYPPVRMFPRPPTMPKTEPPQGSI